MPKKLIAATLLSLPLALAAPAWATTDESGQIDEPAVAQSAAGSTSLAGRAPVIPVDQAGTEVSSITVGADVPVESTPQLVSAPEVGR